MTIIIRNDVDGALYTLENVKEFSFVRPFVYRVRFGGKDAELFTAIREYRIVSLS